jgi:hypothetical protein
MDHTEAADLLQQTLDEETAAATKLSSLAEGRINQEAVAAGEAEEDGTEDADGPAPKREATASAAKPTRRN